MTPLGLGNDLGGSLRVPSQMCGTVALRPSRGRVAHSASTQPWPEPMAIQMTNCQGPMARCVADLRLAFGIITASDARDPRWVPAPLQGPPAKGRVRVAVVRNPAGAGIDPHVRAGVDRAADWLAQAGYDVVDAEPPRISQVAATWFDAMWADVGLLLPGMQPIASAEELRFIQACLAQEVFKPVDQTAQQATWMAIHQHAAEWNEFLQTHPVVLSPVCCERAWVVDEDVTRIGEIAKAMRMVVAVNILGLPSCAVPVGCDEGLPQGVQLIGPRFREDLLLDAAQAIEERCPPSRRSSRARTADSQAQRRRRRLKLVSGRLWRRRARAAARSDRPWPVAAKAGAQKKPPTVAPKPSTGSPSATKLRSPVQARAGRRMFNGATMGTLGIPCTCSKD